MSVICQCPSCKAKYQIGEQYAGRTVKCRKCSTEMVVPAVAPPVISNVAAANEPAPDEPAPDEPAGAIADDDAVSIPGLSDVLPKGSRPQHARKKKKKGLPAWLMTTIVAMIVATIVGIGSTIYLASQLKPHGAASKARPARPTPSDEAKRN